MWLTCNFSLDYLVYNVQQNGYKKKVFILIQEQIPITNVQGNVKRLEGRISKQILGGKGWIQNFFILQSCLGWKKGKTL